MAGKDKVSRKVFACATCDLWRGELRWPTLDRTEVIYEAMQRGICSGPIETGRPTSPLHRCRAWRKWQKMNLPRMDDDETYSKHFGLDEDQDDKIF